jgi:lambda family phage portal protein
MSFREFTHLMAAHFKRDGEFIARGIRPDGKYGFRLQALEPDLLDETLSARLDNGNRIVMGVEMDQWRRTVAFWLRKEDDGSAASMYTYSRKSERVPAKDIYFGFDRTRAFQTRGMSALSTSLLVLHDERQWEKSSLVNARHSAGRLGFLSDPPDSQGTAPLPADETESDGTPVLKLEAGTMYDIGSKTFAGVEAQFPHQQHTPFVKSNLRRAAAGAEVSYYSLSNDYESTSYSSGRLSYGDERERWKMDQQYFMEALLQPIFSAWLEMALTTQAVNLPLAKYDKFNRPEFIGRTWDYVDPTKDAEADLLLDGAGLMSRKRWFAERGLDMETELKQIAAERKMYADLGIEIVRSAAQAKTEPPPPDPKSIEDAASRAIHNLLEPSNGNGHG